MKDKDERIAAVNDTTPSSEYQTIGFLLRDGLAQGWTQQKTGRKMVQHFGHLVERAQENQHGECNVCDFPIDAVRDVAVRQGYVVHALCQTWPKSIHESVNKAMRAYDDLRSGY